MTTKENDAALSRLWREREQAQGLVQTKHRHAEVLERQLRKLTAQLGLQSRTIDIDQAIPPRSGVSLFGATDDERYAPRDVAPVPQRPGSWWPSGAEDTPFLVPNAGHANYTLHGKIGRVIGFDVCGMDRRTLELALEMVETQQATRKDFVPLFLYDGSDFDLFRQRGWVFELLPTLEQLQACPGRFSPARYLEDRRALIERKWGLVAVLPIATLFAPDSVEPADRIVALAA